MNLGQWKRMSFLTRQSSKNIIGNFSGNYHYKSNIRNKSLSVNDAWFVGCSSRNYASSRTLLWDV